MMRDTTKKKTGARIAALVIVGFLTAFVVFLVAAVVAEGELAAVGIITAILNKFIYYEVD